jgi:hypothetical protein
LLPSSKALPNRQNEIRKFSVVRWRWQLAGAAAEPPMQEDLKHGEARKYMNVLRGLFKRKHAQPSTKY